MSEDLFKGIDLTAAQFAQRRRDMSHWVKLAKELYDSRDEKHILTMLFVEVNGDRRHYVVQRIFAHFNSLRRQRDLKAINEFMHNNKRRQREESDDTETK